MHSMTTTQETLEMTARTMCGRIADAGTDTGMKDCHSAADVVEMADDDLATTWSEKMRMTWKKITLGNKENNKLGITIINAFTIGIG
jgi:hypothetical protein